MPDFIKPENLQVGNSFGGASGAGVLQTDANGILLDPSTVALSSLANLADQGVLGRGADSAGAVALLSPSADGQLLKRTSGVVGFGALNATDFAPALAFDQTWTGLQQFEDGIVLTPTTDPVSPVAGQLWFRSSDGALMIREPGGVSVPIEQTGSWTPALRPDTIGDFSATYSSQEGAFLKIGRFVMVWINLVTSAMTWTTASGTMRVTGLPFAAASSVSRCGAIPLHTLGGLSLNTTAGLMEPKLAVTGGGNTTCLFRRTVTGSNTSSGSLALGSGNGFLSGQNVTIQGAGLWYVTNEA